MEIHGISPLDGAIKNERVVKKMKKKTGKKMDNTVEIVKANPILWAAVKKNMGRQFDAGRIELRGENVAVIHNTSDWRDFQ